METRALHDLVAECAKKHPHQTAVIYDTGTDVKLPQITSISYSELLQNAKQLKLVFTSLGVVRQLIGVLFTECLDIPCILLGILSSLCAFHPVNPNGLLYSPDALKKAKVSWILVHSVLLQKFFPVIKDLKGREIQSDVLDKFDLKLFHFDLNSSQLLVKPYGLAYSITTSGTTSSPKVVHVPHTCCVPNILDLREIFQLGLNDRVLLTSPLTFDPSIIDIFCTLSSGACLVIVPSELKKRPEKLLEVIHTRQAITVLQATPTLLHSFSSLRLRQTILGPASSLRILALGGEKFPSASDLHLWLDPNNKITKFFNLYGITEVSCWASCHYVDVKALMEKNEPVPIGQALDKTLIKVMQHEEDDENPNTDEGYIWIGSAHRICIIDDENDRGCRKTEGKASGNENDTSKIVWRNSGDRGKVTPDGNIIYLGREDDQVKRHGKRLNLSAIEMVCRGLSGVLNCCALMDNHSIIVFIVLDPIEDNDAFQRQTEQNHTKEDAGNERTDNSIAAHNNEHGKLNLQSTRWSDMKSRLKNQIETALPSHYMPDAFIDVVDRLPFTSHGKLDKKMLLRMAAREMKLNSDLLSDKESLEHFVERLWKAHLPESSILIQPNDNFISLGGDSLAAVKVISVLENTYNDKFPLLLDILLNKDFCSFVQELERHSQSEIQSLSVKSNDAKTCSDMSAFDKCDTGESHLDSINTVSSVHRMDSKNMKNELEEIIEPVLKISKKAFCSSLSDARSKDEGSSVSQSMKLDTKTPFFEVTETCENKSQFSGQNSHQSISGTKPALVLKKILCRGGKNVKARHSDKFCSEVESQTNHLSEVKSSSCDQKDVITTEDKPLLTGLPGRGTPLLFKLKEKWKFDTKKCVDASPLVVEYQDRTMAFIGSHSHLFSAVDVHTGNALWSIMLPDHIESSACCSICGCYIVVGCYNGVIYVIESISGVVTWEFATGDAVKCSPVLIETTGKILCGSHDGFLYCLDLNAKQCIWKVHLGGGSVFSSPAIDITLHQAYAASLGGKVIAVCCNSGTIKWTSDLHKPIFSSLQLLDSSVLVCSVDGQIHCIDLSGNQKWTFQTQGPIFSTPVVWDSLVLFGSHDFNIYCLNCQGILMWKFQTSSTVYASLFVSEFNWSGRNLEGLLAHAESDQISIYDKSCHPSYNNMINHNCASHDSVYQPVISQPLSSFTERQYLNVYEAETSGSTSSSDSSKRIRRKCACFTPGENGKTATQSKVSHICHLGPESLQTIVTAASSDGNVYILDLKTGNILAKATLDGEIFSSPVVSDNQIFIGCRDNFMYCFDMALCNND